MEPRLEFRDVGKSFRTRNRSDSLRDAIARGFCRLLGRTVVRRERFRALDGVSFAVGAGEVLGIVGANGAGKSTSLRLAAGVYPPTSGEVIVSGRVSALIELSAGFHPDLSGRENIYLGGALQGLRKREVEEVLDPIALFADIGDFLHAPVRTYSSGMAIRLGFAVAAHVPAEILLVDEVLAVGDMEFRAKCMKRMAERREEGTTVLFVSHNLAVIEQFCDRVLFLHRGKILADGSPRETLARYRAHIAEETRVASVRESAAPQLRRGTGRLLLEEVAIAADESGGAVRTGGTLRISGRWRAKEPVEGPIFGVSLHSAEGVHLASTRRPAVSEGGRLEGEGRFAVEVARLDLLPGRYEVSVYALDRSGIEFLDMHQCLYPLEVEGEARSGVDGILDLGATWRLEGA